VNVSLGRIILYVHDVEMLKAFYRDAFGLPVVEEIPDEWAVFAAGACELALHRVGVKYRTAGAPAPGENSNAKLVLSVDEDLAALRDTLCARGIPLGEIRAYPGFTGPICDGTDPEGNVFQLAQA
jgi:catechol 2,3-dioxygenase-like lactoylglutathione lyase family enzyme